jgi:hypothetical protein
MEGAAAGGAIVGALADGVKISVVSSPSSKDDGLEGRTLFLVLLLDTPTDSPITTQINSSDATPNKARRRDLALL